MRIGRSAHCSSFHDPGLMHRLTNVPVPKLSSESHSLLNHQHHPGLCFDTTELDTNRKLWSHLAVLAAFPLLLRSTLLRFG